MNFLELARGILEEAQILCNETNCVCNTREEPCGYCWDLGMAIDRLEDAIAVHTP